jgi:DNA-binding SARP family transcriptional activator
VVEPLDTLPGVDSATCSVAMLGTFEFRVGGVRIELPRAAERLVAYLALQPAPVSRQRVAGALWPDASEIRSLGCLRTALWRVRTTSRLLVDPDTTRLGLAPLTDIDTAALSREAHHVAGGDPIGSEPAPMELFGAELLPGWDDEWVLVEREHFRQLSLSGLEALSRRQLAAGKVLEALEAAWRAITLEPLRESAHHALIDAHLAEGNVGVAVRDLRSFEALLGRELGIDPSPELVDRVASAVAERRTGRVSALVH